MERTMNEVSKLHLHRATKMSKVEKFLYVRLYKRTTHLSWNTSRNNDNLDVLKCLVELVSRITFHLHVKNDQKKKFPSQR